MRHSFRDITTFSRGEQAHKQSVSTQHTAQRLTHRSTMPKTIITFGTFDLFHFGHLRIIQRAASRGDRLVVGVSSDHLNFVKKHKRPACNQEHRMAIVRALGCVDQVFLEESLEEKAAYCEAYGADLLVMGDDHVGKFDKICEGVCPVSTSREHKAFHRQTQA